MGGVKGGKVTDARRLDLSFGKAYVLDAADEVVALDVADPLSPVTLGSLPTLGAASDVKVQGIFAYVGSGSAVQLIDIRDPGNLVSVGNVTTATLSRGVFADENYAYVAGGDALYVCPSQCGFDERVYAAFQPSPQADFYPITVDFSNLSEGYGLSYSWDFGDSTGTSTEKDPTHSYPPARGLSRDPDGHQRHQHGQADGGGVGPVGQAGDHEGGRRAGRSGRVRAPDVLSLRLRRHPAQPLGDVLHRAPLRGHVGDHRHCGGLWFPLLHGPGQHRGQRSRLGHGVPGHRPHGRGHLGGRPHERIQRGQHPAGSPGGRGLVIGP